MTVTSVAFVIVAAVLGYISVGAYVAILAAAAMVASLSDFLFPTKYMITAEKAVCRMLLKSAEIKWADVKRCYVDDFGVKLSPLDRTSRLEAFRGVYLRFDDNESQVIETVKALRPSNV